MSVRDRLRSDRLRAALGEVRIGCEIVVLEKTGSTNDVIREMVEANSPEGLVVFAEHQTAGRGQRGNRWESAPYQGLCLSILLRPEIAISESARLTSWAAEIIAATIEDKCLLKTHTKPPNDVYVGEHKVAGVLVEMLARPEAAHAAILGIGVNVNQTSADFPADLRDRVTSLAMEMGSPQDRNVLAAALLQKLDQTYPSVISKPQ
jgi:BirA family transcriptional regulator, biotin operon repressor / biotin---[acetyl-CoA-carboxylase] ligase